MFSTKYFINFNFKETFVLSLCKGFHFGRGRNFVFLIWNLKFKSSQVIKKDVRMLRRWSDVAFCLFHSLPNDKLWDVTKLRAFADDGINVAQMMILLLIGWRACRRRRGCWLSASSPSPMISSKGFFLGLVRGRYCMLKSFLLVV